jgi:methyl-accepting chemotaxis protein
MPADAQKRKAQLLLRVRENADRSVNTTQALKVAVSDVVREIAKSILAIGRTNERHEASIRMMQELERQAATIGQVVQTVALIADQTNRLTLNAVLDTPHAGEHGKDFTAVIGHGRPLVGNGETSPGDVQALIALIQHDVSLIAQNIQSSATAAREELANGRQTTETLGQIHSDMSGVIIAAAEQQASAIEEINRAAAQITSALDQCRCNAYSCE